MCIGAGQWFIVAKPSIHKKMNSNDCEPDHIQYVVIKTDLSRLPYRRLDVQTVVYRQIIWDNVLLNVLHPLLQVTQALLWNKTACVTPSMNFSNTSFSCEKKIENLAYNFISLVKKALNKV